MRLRKLPYYIGSVAALMRELRFKSWLEAISPGPNRPLELRNGLSLSLSDRLDLLILKEVVHDDAYRLHDLDGEEPRLIVDVGAGFGEFAVLAGVTFPGAVVIAFEPDPVSFALLEANIARNRARNIEAHAVAVGVKPVYELSRSHSAAHTSAYAGGRSFTAPGGRLAELLPAERVDLLKIDCEGGELDVLESLGEEGLSRVRRVVAEYHLDLVPDEDRLLVELLEAHRFTVEIERDPYDPALGYVYARSGEL